MFRFLVPSIDENNPFYCPSVSAASYLQSLQLQRRKTGARKSRNRLLQSFARALESALKENTDSSDEETVLGHKLTPTANSSSEEKLYGFAYSIPAWERDHGEDSWDGLKGRSKVLKRQRTDFSDIQGPHKYAKSNNSVHDSSFDVSVKHEKLVYSAIPGSPFTPPPKINDQNLALELRVRDLEDQLYGPRIGTESPRGIQPLVEVIDRILPGIRFKERVYGLPILSHQSIVDFLGSNGYLNPRILNVFRTSEVRWITLTESLAESNGLNLQCGDILPSKNLRKAFSLTNHSLSIGSNPGITDDAVPPLLLLRKLSFLSILDTGIHMPGLRRLAKTIYDEDRVIDIEIPTACEDYVDGEIHKKYALDPRPPLITDPAVCRQLSTAALQRNLEAHAEINPAILAVGSKLEMAERLQGILEMRMADILVRDMILGVDG
ncbi:hypothetical protein H0H81_008724 [Sphagnurus paluster]|uniref:Uncharacterized protein n=1 Tax=Sphagnurus paluster TaxID=117069 RepID=A0A9P7KGE6_9AGAR|nr:hypothetical protein H0H81_008724 [Sphagnurus paluster]